MTITRDFTIIKTMTSFKHEKYKIKSKRPNTKLPYLRVCGIGRVCEWYGKPSPVQGMDPVQRKLLLLFVTILEKISYIRGSSINVKMTVQRLIKIEKKKFWSEARCYLKMMSGISLMKCQGEHICTETQRAQAPVKVYLITSPSAFLFFDEIKFQKLNHPVAQWRRESRFSR